MLNQDQDQNKEPLQDDLTEHSSASLDKEALPSDIEVSEDKEDEKNKKESGEIKEELSEGSDQSSECTENTTESLENSHENIISHTEECVELSDEITASKKESGILSFLFELAETVAISIAVVMVILTLFVRHSPVNGSSMYPTILGRNTGATAPDMVGEDILLISDLFYTPKNGDIVVIQTPTLYSSAESSMNHPIVKRVIAVGGDTMTIDFENWYIEINGEVYENGRNSTEYVNYTPAPMASGAFAGDASVFTRTPGCTVTKEKDMVYTITIPEGYLFVMGDNRNNSADSRAIGLIDERWVIGRSLIRIYPFDRIGVVE